MRSACISACIRVVQTEISGKIESWELQQLFRQQLTTYHRLDQLNACVAACIRELAKSWIPEFDQVDQFKLRHQQLTLQIKYYLEQRHQYQEKGYHYWIRQMTKYSPVWIKMEESDRRKSWEDLTDPVREIWCQKAKSLIEDGEIAAEPSAVVEDSEQVENSEEAEDDSSVSNRNDERVTNQLRAGLEVLRKLHQEKLNIEKRIAVQQESLIKLKSQQLGVELEYLRGLIEEEGLEQVFTDY